MDNKTTKEFADMVSSRVCITGKIIEPDLTKLAKSLGFLAVYVRKDGYDRRPPTLEAFGAFNTDRRYPKERVQSGVYHLTFKGFWGYAEDEIVNNLGEFKCLFQEPYKASIMFQLDPSPGVICTTSTSDVPMVKFYLTDSRGEQYNEGIIINMADVYRKQEEFSGRIHK